MDQPPGTSEISTRRRDAGCGNVAARSAPPRRRAMDLHFPDATELFILLVLIALPLQFLESLRQAFLMFRAKRASQAEQQADRPETSLPSAEASVEAIRLAKRQFELRREVEAQEQAKLRREAEAKAKRAAEAMTAERSPSPSWIARAWLPLSARAEQAAQVAKMVRERAGSPASGARRALWGSGDAASPRPSASPLSRDDRSQPQAARAARWSGCSWTLVVSLGFFCAGVGDAVVHIVFR